MQGGDDSSLLEYFLFLTKTLIIFFFVTTPFTDIAAGTISMLFARFFKLQKLVFLYY